MQHTLIAVFDNRGDAQKAMDELLSSGFSRQEVRLSEDDAGGQGSLSPASADSTRGEHSIGSGLKNFFSDIFGTHHSEHAQKYSEALTRGHYVLTLTAPDEQEVERAADIVERYGPVDIDERAEQWRSAGLQQPSPDMTQQAQQGSQQAASMPSMQGTASQGSQQRAQTDTTAIPVIQEELKVGKREVERGGVRIYQRVVETPVSESIGLREEHVSVERRPVDQPIGTAEVAAFQETTFEVRETAEEAVVEKTARVVEEVVVGKDVTQRQAEISDTVRRTEVEVEQLAAQPPGADQDAYFRTHWSGNYAGQGGTYDDYAPAYRYGSSMANSDQYRGRPWNDVESNLRTDWEARNPGSAWEKFKAAIRHGWDRITS
jgi:uncharacterized protein (TIGR02271 family)